MTALRTRQDVWLAVWQWFGVKLPHRAFTPGHSTPLDFVADGILHPGGDLAAWANRRGGKTLGGSILAALEYRLGDGPIRGRVLAGSEDQARTLYEYWTEWCHRLLADRLAGPVGRLITRLDNGDFEILAASSKRVRGPGLQRLYWDEVDEIDPALMAASVGTLTSRPGVPARTVAMSTWHHAHGPMSELVAGAGARNIRLHKWNIWETIQRCPVERHEHGRLCESCPLGPACLAAARRRDGRADVGIAAEACGLFAIDDAIKQFAHWSAEQWQAEAECRRPTLAGLVYPSFDRAVHVEAAAGFRDDRPTYRSVDWGLNDFVCLWVQEDPGGHATVVDELWLRQSTVYQAACEIRLRDRDRRIAATFCDPAGRNRNDQTGYSDVEVFGREGLPCSYTLGPWAREVRNGINLVRAALKPACGQPRLTLAGRCAQLIAAMEQYRLRQINGQYVDEPIKPQPCDHAVDALRYYFVNRRAPGGAQARTMGYSG
ncbi:MAG: hypothetical protein GX591_14555 [Planctomycetes bacterium]|nr:hypothetical protein [Planctomycetota bacterium]